MALATERGLLQAHLCPGKLLTQELCSWNVFMGKSWVPKVNTGQTEMHPGLFGGLLPGQAAALCPGLSQWALDLLWLLKPSVCQDFKTKHSGFQVCS